MIVWLRCIELARPEIEPAFRIIHATVILRPFAGRGKNTRNMEMRKTTRVAYLATAATALAFMAASTAVQAQSALLQRYDALAARVADLA